MRLIFFFLVLVNLALFSWGMFFVEDTVASKDYVSAKPEFSDSVKELGVRGTPVEPVTQADSGAASPSPKLCDIVGPFSNVSDSDDFIQRLSSMDVRGVTHELELAVGMSHWLYLPPASSRKEALRTLSELQSHGIDSYVIPKGDLANGISLGMFTRKELADSQLATVIKKGWNPLVKEIERTQIELWVMVNHQDAQKLSDITWSRLMDGFISQEVRQNFCLDVASDQNIH